MKNIYKLFLLSILMVTSVSVFAQIQFTMINHQTQTFSLTNFGSELDISDYRLCSEFFYAALSDAEVIITEGMYVEEGSPLLNITSLSSVWVEAQVYPNELTKSSTSSVFRIYSDSYPDEAFNGKLVYNSPVIEEGKRVQLSLIHI